MAPKSADSAQLALVDVGAPEPTSGVRPGRRRTGRHERQLDRAAKDTGLSDVPAKAAALSAARAAAWALDTAEAKGNPYAVAQLLRPYQDMLTALGLVGDVEGGEQDAFGDFSGPEVVDTPDA